MKEKILSSFTLIFGVISSFGLFTLSFILAYIIVIALDFDISYFEKTPGEISDIFHILIRWGVLATLCLIICAVICLMPWFRYPVVTSMLACSIILLNRKSNTITVIGTSLCLVGIYFGGKVSNSLKKQLLRANNSSKENQEEQ